jgi:ferric iron reductase protein FhuF
VLHSVVPALGPGVLHWRTAAGGPLPLWADAPTGVAADTAEEAAAALHALYAEHLPALVAAVRSVVPVADKVLWGNVASVVAGAKRMLVVGRPAAATRAADVAARLLDTGPLAGTGDRLAPADPDRRWSFRRRSCCLFYRVPGGGYCGDCILAAR